MGNNFSNFQAQLTITGTPTDHWYIHVTVDWHSQETNESGVCPIPSHVTNSYKLKELTNQSSKHSLKQWLCLIQHLTT